MGHSKVISGIKVVQGQAAFGSYWLVRLEPNRLLLVMGPFDELTRS